MDVGNTPKCTQYIHPIPYLNLWGPGASLRPARWVSTYLSPRAHSANRWDGTQVGSRAVRGSASTSCIQPVPGLVNRKRLQRIAVLSRTVYSSQMGRMASVSLATFITHGNPSTVGCYITRPLSPPPFLFPPPYSSRAVSPVGKQPCMYIETREFPYTSDQPRIVLAICVRDLP